jgi:hypothetical protein
MVQSLEMSIFHVCRTPMENDALKELLEKKPRSQPNADKR